MGNTRNTYKGITFADGYSRTFEQFRSEFENTHVFKKIAPKDKLLALKEAYKIATKNNNVVKNTIVKEAEVLPAKEK